MRQPHFQPEITHAFGTPVISFDVPDAARINEELGNVVLQRHRSDPGVIRSNVNSWHSADDLLEWGGSSARLLATTFGDVCGALSEFPSQVGSDEVGWIVRMWANVSKAGASNQAHCHPGAFWSGVYYLSDGGFAADPSVGGQLILHSPHESIATMYAPDVHIRLPTGQRLSSTIVVRPRPGRGILFPSWLMHHVEPYRGQSTRISVALNFSLSPRLRSGASTLR